RLLALSDRPHPCRSGVAGRHPLEPCMTLHPEVAAVTDRVITRSATGRAAYLGLIDAQRDAGAQRPTLGCANLAHAYAGTNEQRDAMKPGTCMNIGIITSYNDMLSAHATYYRYPEQMKIWA